MNTRIVNITPTFACSPPLASDSYYAGRRSFTLVEMLVALAVMILAMAMVTNVFSVTTKTAATSSAIAEVELLLRTTIDQMRQDLEGIDTSNSILALYGRTQGAALTEEARVAKFYYRELIGDPDNLDGADPDINPSAPAQYSDPRADIMMFFTERPCVSQSPPLGYPLTGDQFSTLLQAGHAHSRVQVVYGHAAIAEPTLNGNFWQFPNDSALKHIEQVGDTYYNISILPLNRWHLARRQVLIEQTADQSTSFSQAAFDCISRCHDQVNYPNNTKAADSALLDWNYYISRFQPLILNAGSNVTGLALHTPYVMPFGTSKYIPPANTWIWLNSYGPDYDYQLVRDVIFNPNLGGLNPQNHHFATVIEEPPIDLSDNLGLHLLPGCVWFQVELLIPEDPRNSRLSPLAAQRRDPPRWVSVDPNEMYVFVPDSKENRELVRSQLNGDDYVTNGSRLSTFARVIPANGDITGINYGGVETVDNRIVRMWPYAIRITLKAIDRNGRLEEPITRSFIYRFE